MKRKNPRPIKVGLGLPDTDSPPLLVATLEVFNNRECTGADINCQQRPLTHQLLTAMEFNSEMFLLAISFIG